MPDIQSFKTIFISIILEALPFMLLGVLVSSLMQTFVSERTVQRLVPRNPILGILFACVLGIIFPVCECGMIPVIRRLLQKGMPVYISAVFVIAGPVLNPVVFTSTFIAFRTNPEMAYARMGLAFAVAVFIGLFIYAFVKNNPLRSAPAIQARSAGAIPAPNFRGVTMHRNHHYADNPNQDTAPIHHGHLHDHSHQHGNRLTSTMEHASSEFFEMGKYLIFGAIITAAVQTVLSRESLVGIAEGQWSSHLFMMGFAYILSLCSTSDAFVALSFANIFPYGSLLTFLVFGPMIDLKSTLMLSAVFKKRFVLLLVVLVSVSVFVGSNVVEQLWLHD